MKNSWYARVTSSHHGLVADEITGRTVALVYDDKDTDLISAAPDLLDALEKAVEIIQNEYPVDQHADYGVPSMLAALAKAKGA